jgi:hypothetical protein
MNNAFQLIILFWQKNSVLIGIYLAGFLDLLGAGIIIRLIPQQLESLGASQTLIGAHGMTYSESYMYSMRQDNSELLTLQVHYMEYYNSVQVRLW